MENLENLKTLANQLQPDAVKTNALNLIEEMGSVIEGIGDTPITWKPPFLRLVQGSTDRGSIPRDARVGDFVIGENKLESPFKFIPIRMWDARQYWDSDQTNNKMLCWSPDAKLGYIGRECKGCEHAKWDPDKGSDCSKVKGMLAISADLSKIFTVTFAKSNYKVGMELENLMKKVGSHSYTRTYGLSNTTSPTAKNVEMFKIEVLDDKTRRTPAEFLPFMKELFDRSSADRKAMLDGFYESVTKRKEMLAISGETETLSITGNTINNSDSVVEVQEAKPATSAAKSYTI